jgi:hypothetical protein
VASCLFDSIKGLFPEPYKLTSTPIFHIEIPFKSKLITVSKSREIANLFPYSKRPTSSHNCNITHIQSLQQKAPPNFLDSDTILGFSTYQFGEHLTKYKEKSKNEKTHWIFA